MKKLLVFILICLLLTGCAANNVNPQPSSAADQQEQAGGTQVPSTNQNTDDEGWFIGAIGNAKVHARFETDGGKVSGVYYYDKYKSNIKFSGYINKQIKDMQDIYLTEETDKKGEIYAVFRNPDYIQGVWISGNDRFPLYLIREGAKQAPPTKAGEGTNRLTGYWTGKGSGYHWGSQADIVALSDDLIYYELNAFNGANMGLLKSFGIVNDGVATTVFEDKTFDEKSENVVFKFSLKEDSLNLDSNMYDYGCGAGVGFGESYTKGKIEMPVPTALEIGIVNTKEQDELFNKLVGDRYGEFIAYTAGVEYTDATMDGKKVSAGESILRGASGYCFYVISDEHIYAFISSIDGFEYYTNDNNYANRLPEPIEAWLKSKGNDLENIKIIYHYKELK